MIQRTVSPAACHGRCRPESDDEAKIDRVPYKAVQERGAEPRRANVAASEIVRDLVQSEQFKMID
jgi:hypothetical protein